MSNGAYNPTTNIRRQNDEVKRCGDFFRDFFSATRRVEPALSLPKGRRYQLNSLSPERARPTCP